MSITSLNIGSGENLKSVRARIGAAVRNFVEGRLISGRMIATRAEFTAGDLRAYISYQVGQVAPGSPDRILRDLRQRGVINYELVSRAKSLYRALPLIASVAEGDIQQAAAA
jgi:hypothetical protein